MMKQPILTLVSRCAFPSSVLALSLLTTSCKLPSRATWAMVQQRGLIPVMMSANPEPTAPTLTTLPKNIIAQTPTQTATLRPSPLAEVAPLKVQGVVQPEIAKIPFATPVPGLPGYVFSPHVQGKKMVDVRKYIAGAEVRCPYTMMAFNVPDFVAIAAAPRAPRPRPQRSIAEVASRTGDTRSEVVPMLTPDPTPLPSFSPTASNPAIPYGSRVAGRPGFVYSPFAEKNQLVDVAGIAPGVEVKCPYSNRLFRVPEPLPEELTPPPANVIPASSLATPAPTVSATDSSSPPSLPDNTLGVKAAPSAPVSPTPTAKWADKSKGLIQSPFGSAGQFVDVSGRAVGSSMKCPFTNKEFFVPAP